MTQDSSLNKSIIHQQEKFIDALVGLGDILVTETESKKNSQVIPALAELRKLLEQLLKLRETNPNRFDQLMLDKDYWKYLDNSKREAQMRLSFYPEKYLITFNFLLQQVIRVFETAIKFENEEIIRHASYELVFFLEQVASIEKADLFVKEILKKLWEFSRKSIAIKSIAAHSATYHWYSDIIFDNLRQTEEGFKYEYLPLFNQYFFENIKYLVSQGEFDIFGQLVGHLIDGVHVPNYELSDIWHYDDSLARQNRELHSQVYEEHKIGQKLQALDDSAKKLYSMEDVDDWLKLLKKVREAIYPHLNRANKIQVTKLERKLEKVVYEIFANQTLVHVIFFTGAWAVYKNKPEFIKEIWTHKQPNDAGASYGGNDIFPQDLAQSVSFYFNLSLHDSIGFFWEDHHDSKKYVQIYFLLLLLKHLKPLQPSAEFRPLPTDEVKKYQDIEYFSLPFDNPQELSNAKFVAEGLLATASELRVSSVPRDLELTENSEETSKLVDEKLIPFLKRIIQNAEEKIQKLKTEQPLSESKIIDFREKIFSSYAEKTVICKLFHGLSKLEDKVAEKQVITMPLMGYHQLERREMFFDNWHVDYGDFAEHYGRGLAESEDSNLVKKITDTLERTTEENLVQCLDRFPVTDNTVIFISDDYMYEKLEGEKAFIPFWKEISSQKKEPYFEGWIVRGKRKIKIYNFNLIPRQLYYAIFNADKVGKIVQYYPLLDGDTVADLVGNIRVKIKDFATMESLVEEYLNKSPTWLAKIGDQEQQKQHLLQNVILQIGIKFEFIPAETTEGFHYVLENP